MQDLFRFPIVKYPLYWESRSRSGARKEAGSTRSSRPVEPGTAAPGALLDQRGPSDGWRGACLIVPIRSGQSPVVQRSHLERDRVRQVEAPVPDHARSTGSSTTPPPGPARLSRVDGSLAPTPAQREDSPGPASVLSMSPLSRGPKPWPDTKRRPPQGDGPAEHSAASLPYRHWSIRPLPGSGVQIIRELPRYAMRHGDVRRGESGPRPDRKRAHDAAPSTAAIQALTRAWARPGNFCGAQPPADHDVDTTIHPERAGTPPPSPTPAPRRA